jgi:imidazolonepropionase-like amidohydrolase
MTRNIQVATSSSAAGSADTNISHQLAEDMASTSLEGSNTSNHDADELSFIIKANLLIPGRGEPIHHAAIIIQGKTITWVGKISEIPSPFKKLPTNHVPVLMPGLWDCHTHFIGSSSLLFSKIVTESEAAQGARLARSCHEILMSGFTSVRDLGGHGPEIATVIDEGTIVGPNIYSAGAAISQTAGHGDVFDIPIGWAWQHLSTAKHANGENVGMAPLLLADGVDECRRAVRLQIRRGAQCIKVFASGGVLSIMDDPLHQQFSDEELSVIVEEANRQGRSVAAHVHGKPGILAAIKAGVKTLEHGTYLDEECIDKMKEKDIMLVATRTIVTIASGHPELMDPRSYQKMLETAKHHKAAYQLAIKKGIKCALGTDLGTSVPGQPLSFGQSGGELWHAVDAGMTPLQAIEAATANGPLVLGAMAPKSGQIKAGYDADVIALSGNPLENIGILKKVKNITHVWKGGKLYKQPNTVAPI